MTGITFEQLNNALAELDREGGEVRIDSGLWITTGEGAKEWAETLDEDDTAIDDLRRISSRYFAHDDAGNGLEFDAALEFAAHFEGQMAPTYYVIEHEHVLADAPVDSDWVEVVRTAEPTDEFDPFEVAEVNGIASRVVAGPLYSCDDAEEKASDLYGGLRPIEDAIDQSNADYRVEFAFRKGELAPMTQQLIREWILDSGGAVAADETDDKLLASARTCVYSGWEQGLAIKEEDALAALKDLREEAQNEAV